MARTLTRDVVAANEAARRGKRAAGRAIVSGAKAVNRAAGRAEGAAGRGLVNANNAITNYIFGTHYHRGGVGHAHDASPHPAESLLAERKLIHTAGQGEPTVAGVPMAESPVDQVKQFQALHGLVPDGVVGPKTRAAMSGRLPTAPAPTPSSAGGTAPAATEAAPGGITPAQRAAVLRQYPDRAWMLDDPDLGPLLARAVAEGWSALQLRANVTNTNWFRIHGTAAVVDQLRDETNNWYVPMSDTSLTDWAMKLATGQVQPGEYRRYMQEQAKSLFPSLADAIDRGFDVKTYAAPYVQTAARLMNVDPASINMTDPKFIKALNQVDPTTGGRVSMSLDQWERTIRGDPNDAYGYQRTTQGVNDAYLLASHLAHSMGVVS
jgi:hypothetical protein